MTLPDAFIPESILKNYHLYPDFNRGSPYGNTWGRFSAKRKPKIGRHKAI
jgi:hypothetical protein